MELSDVAESSIRPAKINDQILANLKSTGKYQITLKLELFIVKF